MNFTSISMRLDRKNCLQILKFLLVGIVNTAVGAGLMFTLYNFARCSYWFSSAMNYIAGGMVSFFLNKHFTFQNKEKSLSQLIIFILNTATCYLIAYIGAKNIIRLVLGSLEKTKRDNIALLCGMCLYSVLNFLGQKFIVFSKIAPSKEEK